MSGHLPGPSPTVDTALTTSFAASTPPQPSSLPARNLYAALELPLPILQKYYQKNMQTLDKLQDIRTKHQKWCEDHAPYIAEIKSELSIKIAGEELGTERKRKRLVNQGLDRFRKMWTAIGRKWDQNAEEIKFVKEYLVASNVMIVEITRCQQNPVLMPAAALKVQGPHRIICNGAGHMAEIRREIDGPSWGYLDGVELG